MSYAAQTTSQPNGAATGTFKPQGFDLGDLVNIVAPIVLSTLSANPQLAPQFSIGAGININPFSATPGPLKPQDVDWSDVAHVVGGILSALCARPQLME